jgi:hypothetical protein
MKHIATFSALLAILVGGAAPADEPRAPVAHPVKKMSLQQCNKLADDRKLAAGSSARANYIKDCRTRKVRVKPIARAASPPAQH